MTKVEIYNSDYTNLNHAYIQIYETYSKLLEAEDADQEVLFTLAGILQVFNPTLDVIKSEMTVKTRFKEDPQDASKNAKPKKTDAEKEIGANGEIIFHPKFN
ncbi:MAG: hypothetical protein IKP49_08530 [Treponema sp.]|nr:hypothetical protein [Treponema sp.]MBR6914247.1 hypothetical protein [Treponema sp.]